MGTQDTQARWLATAKVLENLVDAMPHDLTTRQRLAEALQRAGEPLRSAAEYHRVACQYAAMGQALKAVATCRTALEAMPQHVPTRDLLRALLDTSQDSMEVHLPAPLEDMGENSASLDLRVPGLGDPADDVLETREPSLPAARADPVAVHVPRARIAEIPLFSGLSRADLEHLFPLVKLVPMKAGQVLLREGEPGDRMFILVQGMVRVARGAGESSTTLAMLGEGAVVGEMALLANVTRLATAVAETDGVLMELSRADTLELARRVPSLGATLESFLKRRVWLTVIKSNALFAGLARGVQEPLVAQSRLVLAQPGDVLVREHSAPAGLWLVLRGRCTVTAPGAVGLPEMREGDVFGEISLLKGTPTTATVTAVEQSVLFLLPTAAFDAYVRPDPGAAATLEALGTQRLARLDMQLPPEWGA